MTKEEMNLVLDALNSCTYTSSYEKSFDLNKVDDAIEVLEKSLAQQEHGKPLAWYDPSNGAVSTDKNSASFTPLGQVVPLYDVALAKQEQGDPVAWTGEQLQMLNFLYGAGDWDGVWFEQKHPTKRGAFWWRSDLCRLFSTPPAAQKEQGEPVGEVIGTNEYAGFGQIRHTKTIQWRGEPMPIGTLLYTKRHHMALPDSITDDSESPDYRTGWNECLEVIRGLTPQQRKPLTDAEIRKWWGRDNGLEDCDMCKIDDFVKVVRAIEAAHGIKE
jgi:hypothetical protein